VFVLVAEPIASGFVASLAHPSGNMTGFIATEGEIVSKRLELLKEIVPGVQRVAFMFNPAAGQYTKLWLQVAKASAPSLGLEMIEVPIANAAEIETALTAWGREVSAALSVIPDVTTLNNRTLIANLATRYRLPSVWAYRFFAMSGGLVSYGPDITEEYRQSAQYIDQILKGAKAGDLPVQVPTKYELVINLKTAKALGLTVSPTLLARADEVIE
jgi:putative ABC transport system substrate-binding protein